MPHPPPLGSDLHIIHSVGRAQLLVRTSLLTQPLLQLVYKSVLFFALLDEEGHLLVQLLVARALGFIALSLAWLQEVGRR